MRKTLEILNKLVAEKVIRDYAIGDKFDRARFFAILDRCKLRERFTQWQLS